MELVGKTPLQIKRAGVSLAFVPEDRLGMGLVGTMGMTGNMLLRSYRKGHGAFTDRKAPRKLAEQVKEELDVITPSVNFPVRRLSGGKRAEGVGGPGDCPGAHGIDDGLRRPGPGHQHFLHNL